MLDEGSLVDPSVEDLESIHSYIARDFVLCASRLIGTLIAATEALEDLPEQGRRVPEAWERENLRELLVGSYRILYRIEPDYVAIVTVLHGTRDLKAMEPKPWDRL